MTRRQHKKPLPVDLYQPSCAVYEMTLRCNLRCIHCGATAGTARAAELTLDEIRVMGRDLKRCKFKLVALIGGEIFCRKDWYDVARVLKDEGLGHTFITNGLLVGKKPALVDQILATGPTVVGVSLDGARAETHDLIRGRSGSHAAALRAIERLLDRGGNVSVITTLNRLNVDELPLLRDMLLGRGIGWQIQVASINGERFKKELFLTREQYHGAARFIHECSVEYTKRELPIGGSDDIGYFSKSYPHCSVNGYGWYGCKGGIINLGIQSNGNVKGCLSLPDAFVEGNIRERSLYDIWNDPEAFKYSRQFDTAKLQGACRTCLFGQQCKGGCIDFAVSVSGHPYENPYCLYQNGL
ncbi:MAG: radical SAM protein [Deltaproteobacteria bacterium]|nr:radical SAM protein [Deltaproteobacteria bacterium]